MTVAEQFALLSIGLFTIMVRMVVRWRSVGPAQFQVDDYLMPLTGLIFIAEVVAAYLVGAKFGGLTNSYMSDEERADIDPNSEEHYNRVWGSKIQVIGWSFYAAILWGLKICITALYGRLTTGISHLELRVRIAYAILVASYIGVALTLLLSCQPFHHFWQVTPNPGPICQATNSPVYVLVVLITNVVTDLYLLSIPLPLLWGVNISLRRKLTLMLLFSGAVFIILAGTIRAVTILTSGPDGAVSGSLWACRETFVAIIVTNLPIIHPLLRQIAKFLGLGVLLSRNSRSRSQSYPLQSGGIENQKSTGRKGHQHPLSIPNDTAWASDEHILPATKAETNSSSKDGKGGIVVAQETTSPSSITIKHHHQASSSNITKTVYRLAYLRHFGPSQQTHENKKKQVAAHQPTRSGGPNNTSGLPIPGPPTPGNQSAQPASGSFLGTSAAGAAGNQPAQPASGGVPGAPAAGGGAGGGGAGGNGGGAGRNSGSDQQQREEPQDLPDLSDDTRPVQFTDLQDHTFNIPVRDIPTGWITTPAFANALRRPLNLDSSYKMNIITVRDHEQFNQELRFIDHGFRQHIAISGFPRFWIELWAEE
ncbi:hypothetical protein Q7P37_008690 [Cladosporium fusiforme]